jgi:hypothetical protein
VRRSSLHLAGTGQGSAGAIMAFPIGARPVGGGLRGHAPRSCCWGHCWSQQWPCPRRICLAKGGFTLGSKSKDIMKLSNLIGQERKHLIWTQGDYPRVWVKI